MNKMKWYLLILFKPYMYTFIRSYLSPPLCRLSMSWFILWKWMKDVIKFCSFFFFFLLLKLDCWKRRCLVLCDKLFNHLECREWKYSFNLRDSLVGCERFNAKHVFMFQFSDSKPSQSQSQSHAKCCWNTCEIRRQI